nr:uncharacterized protein LOC121817360 isoform X6 [Ovis aries]
MLRSLPVQVRLLLVLAAAGGAQRGAVRQFSSPLLLLAEKKGIETSTTTWMPKRHAGSRRGCGYKSGRLRLFGHTFLIRL